MPKTAQAARSWNIATLPDPVIELCTLAVRLKITVVRRPEARDLMQLPG